jgi:hypothetical protein
MAHKFSELEEKMSPESRARSDILFRKELAEIRKTRYGLIFEMTWAGHPRYGRYLRPEVWHRFSHDDRLDIHWGHYPDPAEGNRQIYCMGEYVGDLEWHYTDE